MFDKISEVELYRNNVISLFRVVFSTRDGKVFERDVVRHLGAVSIVPVLDDGNSVALLSQFRASLGREIIEVPAGKRDVVGEPPEITAVRELEEELGLRCSSLRKLGEFENSPGFTDEHSVSYLAQGFSLGNLSPQSVEEKESSIVVARLSRVPELISSGIITDAKTIIGLSRASDCLKRDPEERDSLYPLVWSASDTGIQSCGDAVEVSSWSRSLKVL